MTLDQLELENKILELVDINNDVTRSDLQGMVTVLAMNYRKNQDLESDIKKVFVSGGDRWSMFDKVVNVIKGVK